MPPSKPRPHPHPPHPIHSGDPIDPPFIHTKHHAKPAPKPAAKPPAHRPPDPGRSQPRPAAPAIGTVQHTVAGCLTLLRTLRRREMAIALGEVCTQLMHEGHLSGMTDVLQQVINSTNHYTHIAD